MADGIFLYLEEKGQANQDEAKPKYAERQVEKYDRMARYSLDKENKRNTS
jgi:hypothetical protein